MFNDSIKLTGELKLTLTNGEGNVTQEVIVPNTVVTAGKNFISNRMKDTVGGGHTVKTQMTHMEVGSGGATAVTAADTTLETIITGGSGNRTALTTAGGAVTANAVAYVCTFAAGYGTGAITEAGIFNASSGGDMLARTVFSAINKAAADTLGITWTITVN
jgi:hypothetical protein